MCRFIKCHQLILVRASYSLAKQLLSIRLGYLKNKQVESINFLLLFQIRVWSLSQLTCPSQGLHKQTTIHSNCIQKGSRLDLNPGLNINYPPHCIMLHMHYRLQWIYRNSTKMSHVEVLNLNIF